MFATQSQGSRSGRTAFVFAAWMAVIVAGTGVAQGIPGGTSAFGLVHSPLGQAQLIQDPGTGSLAIMNLGSSGCDGVEIDLGTYTGHQLILELEAVPAPGEPDNQITFRTFGDVGGIPDQPVSVGTVVHHGDDEITVTGAFPGFGTGMVRVIIREDGIETFRMVVPAGTPLIGEPALNTIQIPRFTVVCIGEGPCPTDAIYTRTKIVTCWGLGGGISPERARGNEVIIEPVSATMIPDFIERAEVTGGPVAGPGTTTYCMTDASLGLGDTPVRSQGTAMLSASPGGGLSIMNLGSVGKDGVCSRYPIRMSDARVVLTPTVTLPSAQLVVRAVGATAAAHEADLGSLELTLDPMGEIAYAADLSNLGAPTQRVELHSVGMPVALFTGQVAPAITASGWPQEIGKLGGPTECFVARSPVGTTYTVNGAIFVADELRILAEGATVPVLFKTGFDILAADIDQIEISALDGTPLAPAYPGTGDNLRLRTAVGAAVVTGGPGLDVKTLSGGQLLTVHFDPTGGRYDLLPPLLLATPFATGNPPASPFPGLQVGLASVFLLVNGFVPGPFGFTEILIPSGNTHLYFVPPGFSGASVLLQVLVSSADSVNHIFATSDAHEIRIL